MIEFVFGFMVGLGVMWFASIVSFYYEDKRRKGLN